MDIKKSVPVHRMYFKKNLRRKFLKSREKDPYLDIIGLM